MIFLEIIMKELFRPLISCQAGWKLVKKIRHDFFQEFVLLAWVAIWLAKK